MYAIIRRYESRNAAEVAKRLEKTFLPVLSGVRGFLGYYFVDEGAGHEFSISLFEDQESAEYSNKLAADWVREHRETPPEPPDICSGEVLLYKAGSGLRDKSA